jgi:hypothetical protein
MNFAAFIANNYSWTVECLIIYSFAQSLLIAHSTAFVFQTGAGIGFPSRAAMIFFAASIAMAVHAFTVALPAWGSNTEKLQLILNLKHDTQTRHSIDKFYFKV